MEVSVTRREKVEDDEYELVPPEGGWGYAVCCGLSAIFIACTAHQPVFGFIYNDFLTSLGEGTSTVTTCFGIFTLLAAIGGFTTNVVLKFLSLRQAGLIGAFTYTLGTFLGIFISSKWHLYITNGILQGAGFGMMIPVAYTSFNSYFTLKKVLYLSLCKASIGLSTMFYPTLMKYTMDNYGFRGTLAIICGIGAQSIIGVMVMQPVKFHMIKKRKVTTSEEKLMMINDVDEENGSREGKESLLQKTLRRMSVPLLSTKLDDNDQFSSRDKVYVDNMYKATSLHSLGNFGFVGAEPLPPIKNKQGKWMTIMEYFDLQLFYDLVYSNIAFGMAFSFFADLSFFTLEPLLLYKYNYNRSQISMIITVGGATDMAARLGLALAGHMFRMKARYLFFAGSLLAAICRIVFTLSSNYWFVLILTGVLGSLRSLLHVPMAIVIADQVPIERYASAYGLFMLVQGFINLTVGPAVGIIRDFTDSYAIAFHILTLCNLLCVVPWLLEAVFKQRKRPNT